MPIGGVGTGHIGTLWDDVARSIEDGKDVLAQLQALVRKVSKDTKFLDEHRKQLRLNLAEEQIEEFRQHIRSFRDGLQLSLQAIGPPGASSLTASSCSGVSDQQFARLRPSCSKYHFFSINRSVGGSRGGRFSNGCGLGFRRLSPTTTESSDGSLDQIEDTSSIQRSGPAYYNFDSDS